MTGRVRRVVDWVLDLRQGDLRRADQLEVDNQGLEIITPKINGRDSL